MTIPGGNSGLEDLLEQQSGFLRGLARRLVQGEDRAQDLAQETVLNALEQRPQVRDPRGWLGCVARRLAGRMQREEHRRRERETASALRRDAPGRGAEDALRELSAAVLELPEPYRQTVLLRYYQDLTPARIADELGIPAATVRTRLKRGLDRLREQLERRGPDWKRRLLPLAFPFAPAALGVSAAAASAGGAATLATSSSATSAGFLGAFVMLKKTLLLVVCSFAALALIATWPESETDPQIEEQLVTESSDGAGPQRTVDDEALPERSGDPAPIRTSKFVEPEDEAPSAGSTPREATIRGRVIDPEGRAVADAEIRVRQTKNSPLGGMRGSEEELRTTRSDADGQWSVEGVPAEAEAHILVRPQRHCDLARRIPITRAGVFDLGDLVVRTGGAIEGRVSDEQGRPLPNATIEAHPMAVANESSGAMFLGQQRDLPPRRVKSDAEGRYALHGLYAGSWRLVAKADGFRPFTRAGVIVRPPAPTRGVNLELRTGAVLAGIVRDAAGKPIPGVKLHLFKREMVISSGFIEAEQKLRTTSDAEGRFVFRGLDDSEYEVTAAKKGFLDLRRVLEKGTAQLRLDLEASPRLVGRVSTPKGALETPFTILVGEGQLGIPAKDPRVLYGAAAARHLEIPEEPGLFTILDLRATQLRLAFDAEGFAKQDFGPYELVPGATRTLDLRLEARLQVQGRVLRPDGQPAGGARVLARPRNRGWSFDEDELPGKKRTKRLGPGAQRETRCTEDGGFVIEGLAEGEWELIASDDVFAKSAPMPLDVIRGAAVPPLILELRPSGRLKGVALSSEGEAVHGARINIEKIGQADEAQAVLSDAQGRFEFGRLSPGRHIVKMALEETAMISVSFGDQDLSEGPHRKIVRIAAGAVREISLREPARHTLDGCITEAGRPAPGVSVTLVRARNPGIDLGAPTMVSDEEGCFRFSQVAAGKWIVKARPEGSALAIRREIVVTEVAAPRVEIALPSGRIEGKVVDRASGEGIPGLRIRLARHGAKPAAGQSAAVVVSVTQDSSSPSPSVSTFRTLGPQPLVTDSEGRFVIRYIAPGDYDLKLRGGDYRPYEQKKIEVHEGARKTLKTITMSRGSTLVVTPRFTGDAPQALFFRLWRKGADPKSANSEFSQGGKEVRFRGLEPGVYVAAVEEPMGERKAREDVVVPDGGETSVTLRLR